MKIGRHTPNDSQRKLRAKSDVYDVLITTFYLLTYLLTYLLACLIFCRCVQKLDSARKRLSHVTSERSRVLDLVCHDPVHHLSSKQIPTGDRDSQGDGSADPLGATASVVVPGFSWSCKMVLARPTQLLIYHCIARRLKIIFRYVLLLVFIRM